MYNLKEDNSIIARVKIKKKKVNVAKLILHVDFYLHLNNTQGGYSGFQVTGMMKWSQKSRPKKIPRASIKTQKNPWTKN